MSINILAIDTTTEACSAALMFNNELLPERFTITPREHTQHILPMVDNLLIEAGTKLNNLDVIAFSRGPGSFTGVRICVGIAQGLALGADLPIIGVSTLATLAEGVWRQTGAQKVLTAIDAHMGEVYWAIYRRKLGSWFNEDSEIVISPNTLSLQSKNLIGYWTTAGTGWQKYPMLLSHNGLQLFKSKVLLPNARDIIPIALHYYLRNEVKSAECAQPIYLRDKVV